MLLTYAPILFLSLNSIGNMKDIVKKHLEGLERLKLTLKEIIKLYLHFLKEKKQGLHFFLNKVRFQIWVLGKLCITCCTSRCHETQYVTGFLSLVYENQPLASKWCQLISISQEKQRQHLLALKYKSSIMPHSDHVFCLPGDICRYLYNTVCKFYNDKTTSI